MRTWTKGLSKDIFYYKISRTLKEMNDGSKNEGGIWMAAGFLAWVMVGWGHTSKLGTEKKLASEARSIPCWEHWSKVPVGPCGEISNR